MQFLPNIWPKDSLVSRYLRLMPPFFEIWIRHWLWWYLLRYDTIDKNRINLPEYFKVQGKDYSPKQNTLFSWNNKFGYKEKVYLGICEKFLRVVGTTIMKHWHPVIEIKKISMLLHNLKLKSLMFGFRFMAGQVTVIKTKLDNGASGRNSDFEELFIFFA